MGLPETDLAELWKQHRLHHSTEARDKLIMHYAPLVKRVVSRLGIPESATLDYQDLVGHGISGLLEAVDRFEPERGFAFETYATQRIRGSVLDALRKLDYVSRSVRRRAGQIERAIVELRNRLGRVPTDEEIAGHLGMDIDAYREALDQINIVFLSLDSPLGHVSEDGGDLLLGEAVEDLSMLDIAAEIEEQDLRMELAQAIRELPEREQIILSLYYYEELTVREVAEVIDLSPSRISQLLARAIMTLRARLVYDIDLSQGRQSLRQTNRLRQAYSA